MTIQFAHTYLFYVCLNIASHIPKKSIAEATASYFNPFHVENIVQVRWHLHILTWLCTLHATFPKQRIGSGGHIAWPLRLLDILCLDYLIYHYRKHIIHECLIEIYVHSTSINTIGYRLLLSLQMCVSTQYAGVLAALKLLEVILSNFFQNAHHLHSC